MSDDKKTGPVTEQDFALMLQAFREEPGNYTHAARRSLRNRVTCKKAWEEGFGSSTAPWGNVPIKILMVQEQEFARAARVRQEQELVALEHEQRVAARKDAIEARGQEALGIKAARRNALALASAAARLTDLANMSAGELNRRMQLPGGLAGATVQDLRLNIRVADTCVKRSVEVLGMCLELERVALGQPIATLQINHVGSMSNEKLLAGLAGVARTLRRAGALSTLGVQGLAELDAGDTPDDNAQSDTPSDDAAPDDTTFPPTEH